MPRILLSTSSVSTFVLDSLGIEHSESSGAAQLPLPKPFLVTQERVDRLQSTDVEGIRTNLTAKCQASSVKSFCNIERSRAPGKQESGQEELSWAPSWKGSKKVLYVESIPLRV